MNGTIKNVQADKRFGFLRDEQGEDRFFHISAVDGATNFFALKQGDAVVFDPEDDHPKGKRARAVRIAEQA